jgi:hypothetical protein
MAATRRATLRGGKTASARSRSETRKSRTLSKKRIREDTLKEGERKLMELFMRIPMESVNSLLSRSALTPREKDILRLAVKKRAATESMNLGRKGSVAASPANSLYKNQ